MADEIIINTSPQPEVIISYNATVVQGGTGFTGSAGQIGTQGYTGSAAFGSLNTRQNTASTSTVTVSNTFPVTVGTVTITVDNNPVSVVATGDIIGTNTPTGYMQLFRNDVAIGQEIRFSGSSSSAAIPYNIVVTDTPGAGTHVYTLKATRTTNARFGSSAGPTLIATELANVRGYTGSIGSVANQSLDTTSNVEFASVESANFKANNSDFITISGNTATIYTDLIPSVDAGYDLGSVTNKWRSLYVSTNTIYIDNVAVSVVDNQLAVNDQQIGFGYTGSLGYVGSQGPIGYAGSQGIQGTQGTQGVQGVQGLQGLKGDTGLQGATGYVGSTGAQGDVGYVGSIGYAGSQGIQGEVGFTGSQGEIGFTGSQGDQGIQGDIGYVGSQGDMGYVGSQGDQGNPGVSVNIKGEVATTSLLPTGAAVGDAYIVTADGNLYTWTSTEWLDVGQIVGPQGEQGTTGYVGSQGIQGEIGFVGSQGDTGYVGSQGIQGEIGYTGSTGDQGIQGEIGYTGSIGYAGSQGDQGSIGYTGSTGDQGIQGVQGVQGEQGIQGEIGYTGSTGERGEQGFTGDQGPAGDNGANALWNFTSEYNSGAAYAVGDLATYDGSTWYRIDANGGNVGDTPSEGTFWTAIAAKGTQGEIGYVGSQGEIGYVGSQGIQGDIGYTGSQGDIGYTGSAGADGSIGYTGSQGEQGIQGEIGYTGSAGEQGIQGEIGYTGSAGDPAGTGDFRFNYGGTNNTMDSVYDGTMLIKHKSDSGYNIKIYNEVVGTSSGSSIEVFPESAKISAHDSGAGVNKLWSFEKDGKVVFPDNSVIEDFADNTPLKIQATNKGIFLTATRDGDVPGSGHFYMGGNYSRIRSYNANTGDAAQWYFENDGTMEFPDGTIVGNDGTAFKISNTNNDIKLSVAIDGDNPGPSEIFIEKSTGNVTIKAHDAVSGSDYSWLFSASDGNLVFPNSSAQSTAFDSSSLANIGLQGFTETVVSEASTATFAPNVSLGTVYTIELTGDIEFNEFTNPQTGQSATVILTQDATGGHNLTSTMLFAGGSKTLTTSSGAVDVLSVLFDGSRYIASLSKGHA